MQPADKAKPNPVSPTFLSSDAKSEDTFRMKEVLLAETLPPNPNDSLPCEDGLVGRTRMRGRGRQAGARGR